MTKAKGVSLIALVVTIAIMIILAGVTITAIFDKDGILNNSKEFANKVENKQNRKEQELDRLTNELENEMLNNNYTPREEQISLEECKENSMLTKQTNTVITIGDYEVTIPAGYMVTADSGNTVEEGIVITDALNNGNEWVWVPVSNSELANMYVDSSASPKQLYGTTATYENARTKYYTASEIITGIARAIPGADSEAREPDIVIGLGNQYDYVDTNRITAGFYIGSGENKTAMTLNQMAQLMIIDYDNMLNSIRTNKGFYIGRYELGAENATTVVVKKGRNVKTYTSWYQFYSDCKSLAKGSNVTTRMIYGLQWDATCNWLANNDFNITNSSTWGNYSNYNTANNYTSGQTGYESEAGIKKQTGYSDNWSACNIYDFAGNCEEWTQEGTTGDRSYRGGRYGNTGSSAPASHRYHSAPSNSQYETRRLSPRSNN